MAFVCKVCGYVYEGPEAPDECPLCHKKDVFIEQGNTAMKKNKYEGTFCLEHPACFATSVREGGYGNELTIARIINCLLVISPNILSNFVCILFCKIKSSEKINLFFCMESNCISSPLYEFIKPLL